MKENTTGNTIPKNKKLPLLIALGVLVLFAIGVYSAAALYYTTHFYSNTIINDMDCTGLTVEETKERITENLTNYVLAIVERNDVTENLTGTQLELTYNDQGEIETFMSEQNPWLWPASIFYSKGKEIPSLLEVNETVLESVVDSLACMQTENVTQPVNAYIGATENGYGIIPEQPGTLLDRNKVLEAVRTSILSFSAALDLEANDCYVAPTILQNDAILTEKVSQFAQILAASLTMDFGSGRTEVLDSSIFDSWISTDENGNPVIGAEQAADYVHTLAERYNTVDDTRTFTTTNGQTVSIVPGDYGWVMDEETTTQAIIDALTAGTQGEFSVTYEASAKSRDINDLGNTYIELSIQDQKFWVYVDGQMVLESVVVTGTVSKGYDTPVGAFKVKGKATNYTMYGEKDSSGNWSYTAFCNYWIPFTANNTIGFHDLTSRTNYSNTAYLTSGSHGCVNTPLENVKKLYDMVSYGFPVIVY